MYIDIHTHTPSSEKDVISILNINVPDYIRCCGFDLKKSYSLGIHPWKINEQLLAENLRFIEDNIIYGSIKAIGECGLDRLADTDWDLQLKAFHSQILISEKAGKPLIIHCVKAFDELLALKKEIKPKQAWIIHDFRGKPQQMRQLTDHGLYLSFGINFNSDTLKQAPLDRLFLETDDKGISIKQVYKKISEAIGIEEGKLIGQVRKNYEKVLFY